MRENDSEFTTTNVKILLASQMTDRFVSKIAQVGAVYYFPMETHGLLLMPNDNKRCLARNVRSNREFTHSFLYRLKIRLNNSAVSECALTLSVVCMLAECK